MSDQPNLSLVSLGKSVRDKARLATPNQQQQSYMLCFLGYYPYTKILRHWLVPSWDTDNLKICTFISWEHVLPYNLELCALNW